MTVVSSFRPKLALLAVLSLFFAMFPFGAGVTPAMATAGTGALWVVASGGDAQGTEWTFSSGTITTVDGDRADVNASDVVSYLNAGNLEIVARTIVIASDVVATLGSSSLTLKSAGSIIVNGGVEITTLGGDIIFWSNSGDTTGNIRLGQQSDATRGRIVSNGGHIRFGGGTDFATGYATGTSNAFDGKPFFGIASWGFYINAGGGDISMRARLGVDGSTRAILMETANSGAFTNELITSGDGTVSLLGDASTRSGGDNQWGV